MILYRCFFGMIGDDRPCIPLDSSCCTSCRVCCRVWQIFYTILLLSWQPVMAAKECSFLNVQRACSRCQKGRRCQHCNAMDVKSLIGIRSISDWLLGVCPVCPLTLTLVMVVVRFLYELKWVGNMILHCICALQNEPDNLKSLFSLDWQTLVCAI